MFENLNIDRNQEMAQIPNFETNHLKAVPTFEGETNTLSRFISSCELLLNHFYNPQDLNCYQNKLIIHCLIGKLAGKAKLVVESQPVNTWNDLKDVLTRNFSDSRNEENLIIDLTNMRQKSGESSQIFYERCLTQLAVLNTRCNLHEPAANRQIKIDQYTKLTLSIFLNGLFEPLRTNILNMRPATLAEAVNYIKERENNNAIFNRNRSTQNQIQNLKQKTVRTNQQTTVNQPRFTQYTPQQPNQNFSNQNFRQQNFNRPVSQQIGHNASISKPNQNPNYPTPMSGVSTIKNQPQRFSNVTRHTISNFNNSATNTESFNLDNSHVDTTGVEIQYDVSYCDNENLENNTNTEDNNLDNLLENSSEQQDNENFCNINEQNNYR